MNARRLHRSAIARWLAALGGAGLAAVSPATAQSVSPAAAPAEWVRYAEAGTATVVTWLQAEDETAVRLRAYLDATRPAADQLTPPLEVRLWVDATGTVTRLDFAPFAHPEPNADLRALVAGRRLAAPPPRGMLLPMRIAIQLDPAEPAPAGDGAPPDQTGR